MNAQTNDWPAVRRLAVTVFLALFICVLAGCGSQPENETTQSSTPTASVGNVDISAADAIVGVSTIGFVDTDGSKVSAIIVEYNVTLEGSEIDVGAYEIENYGISQGDEACEIGKNPGKAVKAYVNDKPDISATGGTSSGNYVIIEVNTDYQLGSVSKKYQASMAAGVVQIGNIAYASGSITPSEENFTNYTPYEYIGINPSTGGFRDPVWYDYADEGKYTILGTEGFELHTIDGATGYKAFSATNCFDEANGEYWDFDLPYALYVPEDYDASKEYALVLHVHDAGFMGIDPMITLTEAQGPVNFASAEVQQIAKDKGLGGVIVVAPQISEAFYMDEDRPTYNLRASRDNWSVSAAVPATWQLMDYLTKTYNIDMNRIYGTGQSMGAMQVVAMAAQRDNYFAALWPIGFQWGNNFNKEVPYGKPGELVQYYPAPADGDIIWTEDTEGNEYDYRNWYYMISDDNILITKTASDAGGVWKEFKNLYSDLVGVEFPTATWNPLASKEEQNAALNALVAQENDLGIYFAQFSIGSHMSTWIYAHNVSAAYEWLLNQTRDSEMERYKLDLDKPFERADEQLLTDDRLYYEDKDNPANNVYVVTGKRGAGTDGYNSALSVMGGDLFAAPGWMPDAD